MNFAEFGVVQIGIFVCQPLAFDFGSHHERVHRPTEALLPARRLFAADDTASSNWSASAYALSTAAFAGRFFPANGFLADHCGMILPNVVAASRRFVHLILSLVLLVFDKIDIFEKMTATEVVVAN